LAAAKAAFGDKLAHGGFDGDLGMIMVEGVDTGLDAPVEDERIGDAGMFANGNNGAVAGPTGGCVAGHVTAYGEHQKGVGLELVGEEDGALNEFLAGSCEFGAFVEAGVAAGVAKRTPGAVPPQKSQDCVTATGVRAVIRGSRCDLEDKKLEAGRPFGEGWRVLR
jgi:hypothetical protein